MRICVCATQVPFTHGGAEIHVECLVEALDARGFATELVTLPFSWHSRDALIKSALAWRMLDLRSGSGEAVDLVIATRFPSYLISHPHKVVWLIHQFRQAYDLLGTPYGCFTDSTEDRALVETIRIMDQRGLGEAKKLFANARNTASRLQRFNGLDAKALYPPPKLFDRCRPGPYGDYVFGVGRLDRLKRFDHLVRAMAHAPAGLRARIAGSGPERNRLESMAAKLGVSDRVDFLGFVPDERLVDELAGALAVYYAPFDEDFGYVTVEAFQSVKPVLTARDSGGVLEFVVDGENGFVVEPGDAGGMGRSLRVLFEDRSRAQRMGEAGKRSVEHLSWDFVVRALTGRDRGDERRS